jgi:hypothetical protein
MAPSDPRFSDRRPDTDARSALPQEQPSALRRLVRYTKGVLVFLIVAFHLIVLAIRNPLDLWYDPIRDWFKARGYLDRPVARESKDGRKVARRPPWFDVAHRFTWKYTNLVGCEQRWTMFTPRMARGAPFFGVRLKFTDGSTELLRSELEPEHPDRFFRMDGWQTRKLENCLLEAPKNLATDSELPFWEAYARHYVRKWRTMYPDDPRTIDRVLFVRRYIAFPDLAEGPHDFKPVEETVTATFDAEGKVRP